MGNLDKYWVGMISESKVVLCPSLAGHRVSPQNVATCKRCGPRQLVNVVLPNILDAMIINRIIRRMSGIVIKYVRVLSVSFTATLIGTFPGSLS